MGLVSVPSLPPPLTTPLSTGCRLLLMEQQQVIFLQPGLWDNGSEQAVYDVVCNGYLTERWGHRHVILVSLVFMTAFIVPTVFAENLGMLVAGQVLCVLPCEGGMLPLWEHRVLPRWFLLLYTNICWITGQILSAHSPSCFFSQAGLATNKIYKLNLGVTTIAWMGTATSWVLLLSRFGRRSIFLAGLYDDFGCRFFFDYWSMLLYLFP